MSRSTACILAPLDPIPSPSEAGRAALRIARMGVITLRDGLVAACDARALELLGGDARALAGRDPFAQLELVDDRFLAEGAPLYAVRHRAPRMVLEVSRGPGEVPGTELVVLRDATTEHEQREQLRAAWGDLEAFAYGASHDLQAPLRSISRLCEIIAEVDGLDDQTVDCARRAMRSADDMSGLVQALLQYSRAGNPRRPLRVETLELRDLVSRALSLPDVADHCPDAEIEVEVEGFVQGDPWALCEVVAAVLGNATRYVAWDDHPRITVKGTQSGPRVELRIEDHGIGIDPKHAEQAFAPFRRLCAQSEYPGHGLALATARRQLARIGGTIELERSALGEGCTFLLVLPGAREHRP